MTGTAQQTRPLEDTEFTDQIHTQIGSLAKLWGLSAPVGVSNLEPMSIASNEGPLNLAAVKIYFPVNPQGTQMRDTLTSRLGSAKIGFRDYTNQRLRQTSAIPDDDVCATMKQAQIEAYESVKNIAFICTDLQDGHKNVAGESSLILGVECSTGFQDACQDLRNGLSRILGYVELGSPHQVITHIDTPTAHWGSLVHDT